MTRLVFLLLLLLAAFKDDSSLIAQSEYYSELAWHPLVSGIKRYSWIMFLLLAGVGFISLIRKRNITFGRDSSTLLIVALSGFAFLRGGVYSEALGIKLLVAFVLIIFIYIYTELILTNQGLIYYESSLRSALVLFSLCFILLNALNYFLGYGFVPGNPRYFGTTTQPNFIGVQLAICNIILLSKMQLKRVFSLVLLLLIFVIGVLMQIASGSRTGLIVLMTGIIAFCFAKKMFSFKRIGFLSIISAFVIGIVCVAFLYFSPYAIMLAFDRGLNGADTRSEVWRGMIGDILNNPLFGVGYSLAGVENSYLRGAANYGLFYAVFLLWYVQAVVRKFYKLSVGDGASEIDFGLYFSLALSLAFGGIFEGYLVDSVSVPLFVFILVSTIPFRKSHKRFVAA